MDDKEDEGQPFDWGIEVEEVKSSGTLLPGTFCVKAIDVLTSPTFSAPTAMLKLVKLPKTYKLSADTRYASIVEWPEGMNLPMNTALVKIADTPAVRGASAGTVVIDTYRMPSDVPDLGPGTLGIRVPPYSRGVLQGIAKTGIRVPIIPPGIIRKK
jgi:hypothetical protein